MSIKVVTTSTDESELAHTIIKNNLKYKSKIAVLQKSLDNLITAQKIIHVSASTPELHAAFDTDVIFKLLDETYNLYLNAYEQFELIGTGWYQLCKTKGRTDLIDRLNSYGDIVKKTVRESPHMLDIKATIWDFENAVQPKAYNYLAIVINDDLAQIDAKYVKLLNQYNNFANNPLLDSHFIIQLALSYM